MLTMCMRSRVGSLGPILSNTLRSTLSSCLLDLHQPPYESSLQLDHCHLDQTQLMMVRSQDLRAPHEPLLLRETRRSDLVHANPSMNPCPHEEPVSTTFSDSCYNIHYFRILLCTYRAPSTTSGSSTSEEVESDDEPARSGETRQVRKGRGRGTTTRGTRGAKRIRK